MDCCFNINQYLSTPRENTSPNVPPKHPYPELNLIPLEALLGILLLSCWEFKLSHKQAVFTGMMEEHTRGLHDLTMGKKCKGNKVMANARSPQKCTESCLILVTSSANIGRYFRHLYISSLWDAGPAQGIRAASWLGACTGHHCKQVLKGR